MTVQIPTGSCIWWISFSLSGIALKLWRPLVYLPHSKIKPSSISGLPARLANLGCQISPPQHIYWTLKQQNGIEWSPVIFIGYILVTRLWRLFQLIIKFLCLDNILLTVISQVLMAKWKISNNFVEEMAIKILSTTGYIQNKNNLENTALYFMINMGVFPVFFQIDMMPLHFPSLLVEGGSKKFLFCWFVNF